MVRAAAPPRTRATPGRARLSSLLVGGLPRLLLNSLAPIGSFYVCHRLAGVVAGILAGSVVSLLLFSWERLRGRPGVLATLSLCVVLLQAVMGLGSRSAFMYFLPSIGVDLTEGLAFSLSALTSRPLASLMAREILPLPASLLEQPDVLRLFRRITLAWGGYFILRGLTSFIVLSTADTSDYVLTRVLIDLPVVIPLLGGSLAYGLRRLDRLAPGYASSPPASGDVA